MWGTIIARGGQDKGELQWLCWYLAKMFGPVWSHCLFKLQTNKIKTLLLPLELMAHHLPLKLEWSSSKFKMQNLPFSLTVSFAPPLHLICSSFIVLTAHNHVLVWPSLLLYCWLLSKERTILNLGSGSQVLVCVKNWMSVSPWKFTCWHLNSQFDGIRR